MRELDTGAQLPEDLPPELRQALESAPPQALSQLALEAGEYLMRRGEPAHSLFVVLQGQLRASLLREDGSDITLSVFGPGAVAGEMAILTGSATCSADVSAVTAARVLRMSRDDFEALAQASPVLLRAVSEGARRRMLRDQLLVGLTGLFGEVTGALLAEVEARAQWLHLGSGETLFHAGDEGQALYFVLGGRLRARSAEGRTLSEMSRGECIGEIALLTGDRRTATVEAVRDSDLVGLTRAAFDEIATVHPELWRAIARVVARRLSAREKVATNRDSHRCLAVLPASPRVDADRFCGRLLAGLAAVGSTLHLCAAGVDRLLNHPGIAQAEPGTPGAIRLNTWLDEQEARTRFLLYQTDGLDSAWTRRCLRQADQILLVADARDDPAPGALESLLLADPRLQAARLSLVLLHRDGSRLPTGTRRWFVGRRLHNHFHVRLDTEPDFARLGRCLGDAAVGLVLGGGGARGLAHIGVIRALREAGVPIDMIGGTSMGAVIAGGLGMGLNWRESLEISRTGWLRHKPHKEYTLPLISIVRSRVLDRWAREIYGDTDMEDLWVSFFCVSCNLSAREMSVFERGPLWKAVRASAALPGIFVPVVVDGDVYVDGAIVNNLPGDVMRRRSCGLVVTVDVGWEREFSVQELEFPSPWRLLWSHLGPFATPIRVPNIVSVLMRTTEVGSKQKTAEAKADADLCLSPPMEEFGVLEFAKIDRIVEAGYRYAADRLDALSKEGRLPALFAAAPEHLADPPRPDSRLIAGWRASVRRPRAAALRR